MDEKVNRIVTRMSEYRKTEMFAHSSFCKTSYLSLLYTIFSGYLDGVNYENYGYENANLLNPSSDGLSLTGLGAEAGYTADLIKQGGFALLRDLATSLFAPKKSENIVLLDDRFASKNSNLNDGRNTSIFSRSKSLSQCKV